MERISPFALFALLLTLGSVGASLAQVAAVPQLMNFQGRLARPDGTPVLDGTYSLRFSLWDAVSSGTEKWNQTQNVTVRNGTFAVLLSGFPGGTFNGNLFLEIKVGTDPPLTPRQQLVSVAYAMKANTVPDSSIGATQIANGSITGNKLASNALNPIAWLLGGNSGTTASNFLGTTDNQPLTLKVNSRRAMRYQYAENTSDMINKYRSINALGGSEINSITAGVVGATIAGGGYDDFSFTDLPNKVTADFGTVGGGQDTTASGRNATVGGGSGNTASGGPGTVGGGLDNTAGNAATVGGGVANTASGFASTVAGGYFNTASGERATVGGGSLNTAAGIYSFAAGRQAKANHEGVFVWGDSTDADFASTAVNQFLIRAAGGVGIGTNSPGAALHVVGAENNGTTATLKITSGTQSLLLDGNEIDSDTTLVLNNNSANNVLLANGGGRVGIDIVPASTYKLHVNGVVAGVGNYVNASDGRYKMNIATFPDALDAILNLRGVTFDWKRADFPNMHFSEGRQIGFIAQEVETVLPELVLTDANGYKSVAYTNVVPVLVEAVKALKKENDGKEERLRRVEAENAELRAELKALRAAVEEIKTRHK
jgi:hypothetical protein